MQEQIKHLDFNGQDYFVGIDIHKKRWTITIRWNKMELKTYSMNPDPKELKRYMHRHYPGGNYFSVYEAGFSGYWIHRQLSMFGFKNIVVNPCDVPTTNKEKDQKTDRIDSRKLARELEHGSLKKGIYIPTEYHQQLRSLIRLRQSLVKEQTRIKNRIKSFLHYNGIALPAHSEVSYWSGHFIHWLSNLEFPYPTSLDYLKFSLNSLSQVRKQIAELNRRLREHIAQSEFKELVRILSTVPGIAFVSGLILIGELMDRSGSLLWII